MYRTFLPLLVLVISFSSCKKTAKLTQFNMEFNEVIVIPSSTGMNLPFNIQTPDIETNSEATFEINDTRKDLVEEIKLTHLNLILKSPENADFNFLKSTQIYLSAPNLNEIKIAWKDSIPDHSERTINLEITNSDLKEYIKKENFNVRVNVITDEFLATDYEVEIQSIFFVKAKLFKKK